MQNNLKVSGLNISRICLKIAHNVFVSAHYMCTDTQLPIPKLSFSCFSTSSSRRKRLCYECTAFRTSVENNNCFLPSMYSFKQSRYLLLSPPPWPSLWLIAAGALNLPTTVVSPNNRAAEAVNLHGCWARPGSCSPRLCLAVAEYRHVKMGHNSYSGSGKMISIVTFFCMICALNVKSAFKVYLYHTLYQQLAISFFFRQNMSCVHKRAYILEIDYKDQTWASHNLSLSLCTNYVILTLINFIDRHR